MLHVTRRYDGGAPARATLRLPLEWRRRSRLRTRLVSGEEVGIILPYGSILRDGDKLLADDGTIIAVEAAPERVSVAKSRDALALTRAAYHLGNRHVLLQIGDGWLSYQHDHVLDAMVCSLGLEVSEGEAAFEPEVGPYTQHDHAHGGAHGSQNHHHHD